MTPSDTAGQAPEAHEAAALAALDGETAVRPTGAWVVGGFVAFTVVAMWALVSLIFLYRS